MHSTPPTVFDRACEVYVQTIESSVDAEDVNDFFGGNNTFKSDYIKFHWKPGQLFGFAVFRTVSFSIIQPTTYDVASASHCLFRRRKPLQLLWHYK